MKSKKFILLCLILFILSLACVSASEDANQTFGTSNIDGPDAEIVSVSNDGTILNSYNDNQTLTQSENNEILAAGNNIWYVNESQTGGNGTTPETAFKTLNDAIQSSGDGDTIMIASGTYTGSGINVNLTTSKQLSLIKYGDGEAIFDGQGNTRILNITSLCFNITGLTFKNGKSDDGGALCFINTRVSDLEYNINAIFINNTATRFGGAIYINGKISYSNINGTFISNKAQCGGANYFEGIVALSNINGTYTNNSAEEGGANEFYGHFMYSSISGRYINNTASNGSILSFFSNTTKSSVKNAIFLKNNYDENKTVIYSQIYGLEVDFTWFGNDETNYLVKPRVSNMVSMYRWLFLNGTAASNKFKFFLMKYNEDSGIISQYDNTLVGKVNLTITATNTTIGKDYALLNEEISYEQFYSHAFITAQFENVKYAIELKRGDFNLLQELIYKARTNDVINLTRDYTYDEYDRMTEGVLIDRIITINGNGHSIDAKGKTRIFKVISFSFNITNVTLKNGKAESGGAIYFTNPVSNININATYINNIATQKHGGANYFCDRVLNSVINGTYIDNKAKFCGGANYFLKEIINSNINGTYINNLAEYYGGANHFQNTVTNLNINGTYRNNKAYIRGGANYFCNIADITINGLYINNTANSYGGANCFETVSGITVNGTYINNTAAKEGGANCFYESISDMIITGLYINNTANNNGGANSFVEIVTNSNITGIYINNTATTASGGANYFYRNIVNMIINGTYINNSAGWHGGVNCFYKNVTGSTIIGLYVNNTASSNGGANIFESVINTTNLMGTYINNTAIRGGANYIKAEVSGLNMTGLFINNTAYEDGIIFIAGAPTDVNISNAIFLNNKGSTEIYAKNNGTVANNNWFGNNATNYKDKPNVGSNVKMDSWLFLNADADSSELNISETSTIAFKLDSYNDTSKDLSPYDASKMNVIIKLSQTLGKLNQTTALIDEEVLYTAKQVGNASVTGTFETAYYTINLINNGNDINVVAEDLIKYYGGNERFVVTVFDSAGNPLSNKAVSIKINGVTYTRTTNDEGIATLNINLNSGNYTATTTVEDVTINSTVTVLPTVTGSDITSSYNEAAVYNATFLDSTGNYLTKGTTVRFNINGALTNESISNDEGLASLAIKLPAGEYTVTAINTVTGESTSNTINITKADLNLNASAMTFGQNTTIIITGFENATGNVLVDVGAMGYYAPITMGMAFLSIPQVDKNVTADIYYLGDNNYNNASTSIYIVAKKNLNLTASADSIYAGENATIIIAGFENATGNVTVIAGRGFYNATIADGAATVIVPGLNNTTAAYIFYGGDDNYNMAYTSVNITVLPIPKENLTLEASAEPITADEDAIIVVEGFANATGNVTAAVNGEEYSAEIVDGSALITVSGLTENTTALISYPGDDNYNAANATVEIAVNPAPVPKKDLTLNASAITLGQNTTIVITGFENATGNVSVTIGENNYTSPIMMGMAFVSIPQMDENVTAYIYYPGDDNYNNASTTVDIIAKMNLNITASADSIYAGENATIIITGFENATGNVTVIAGRGFYNATIADGTATVTVPGLNNNTTAIIMYMGDNNYNMAFTSVNITVLPAPTPKENLTLEVTADPITAGEDAVIVVSGLDDATGNVTVTVNGEEYSAEIVDGTASIIVPGLTENATALISYPGDDNYNAANATVDIVVNPKPKENATMDIDVPPVSEGQNTTVNVDLPEDATGTVTATVDGKNYTAQVKDGKATITITELAAGNYTVPVTYSGDDKYNPVTKEVNVTVEEDKSDIISAPDVTKYYKGSERFVVSVTDYQGNPLANKTATIVINGATYTRNTNANGNTSIALGLNSGVYNVTTTVDNQTVNSVVTILATVNGTDIVKMYRNGTQYYATFLDSEGNFLADGTAVKFNINGVMYDRKVSGGKGQAKLNINLEQGTYVITAINPETGENAANNITVLSLLTENNDLTKYYRNASQYTVKVLDEYGKAVGAGVTVKFNINGVFYERQTNASGIAKLNINLQPGDYVITAEYNNCRVSNDIKVLPVLSASDISMKYRDGTKFVATLVDGQGKPYAGQNIEFNINGVFYNRATDSNGQAKLNINLMAGEYIITSSFNGASISNTIKITA